MKLRINLAGRWIDLTIDTKGKKILSNAELKDIQGIMQGCVKTLDEAQSNE